jgi:hypothetical protein
MHTFTDPRNYDLSYRGTRLPCVASVYEKIDLSIASLAAHRHMLCSSSYASGIYALMPRIQYIFKYELLLNYSSKTDNIALGFTPFTQ